MTKRYRFYTWSVGDSSFSKLRERLTSDTYTEDAGQGFHLLRATRHEIEGRFVQRIPYTEEVFSPEGILSVVDRIGYVHTAFRLRPGECGLLLLDPPRSVSALLHRFSQILDYDVTVQATKLNLINLKRALQIRFGKARVTSVNIKRAVLAENAMANITVVDPQDALESALALFPQYRKCIGKLDFSFGDIGSSKIHLSASRAGSINTNTERFDIVDSLWEAVIEANK